MWAKTIPAVTNTTTDCPASNSKREDKGSKLEGATHAPVRNKHFEVILTDVHGINDELFYKLGPDNGFLATQNGNPDAFTLLALALRPLGRLNISFVLLKRQP